MAEILLVVGIVAIVAVRTGSRIYRAMTGKNDACGCVGGCRSRACKGFPETEHRQDGDR